MECKQTYFIIEYVGPFTPLLNQYSKFVRSNQRFIDVDFDTDVWEWKSFERAYRCATKQKAVEVIENLIKPSLPPSEYAFITGFVIVEVQALYTCKPGETIELAKKGL